MTADIPDPVFLSAPKAATLCGVSRNTLCCWIRDGKLDAYRTAGGKYLIRPQQLLAFMNDNQMFIPPALTKLVETEKEVTAGASAGSQSESNGNGAAYTALVVDDEPTARRLAVRALESENVVSLEAENGFEALHLLVKNEAEIDVVLLDLVMPGKNGIQIFKEIREMKPSLPVIFVTAFPPQGEDILEEEPDLIITKPYRPRYLCNAVLSCVMGRE